MTARPLLVRVAASLIVLTALAAAQDQPRPTFKTEANYVRVDVFPTKDGQPVADLTAEDFEIVEDKVPQKVDAFEHIVVRGNVPQDARREPNTIRESRAMLDDPNARAFVVFLDVNHVEVEGSHNIRKPLVGALDRMIGENDLVAVMTPEMSAGDITFARKTTTIEGMLTRHWTWGERNQVNSRDPMEDQYRACYPGFGPTVQCKDDDRGVADEMIARRREKQTIDALEDLVRFLRGVREERKAVIAITDGWLLYRPNRALARQLYCTVPQPDQVQVDPRTGKLTTKSPPGPYGTNADRCDKDRMMLSEIDDDRQFRELLDAANRANTSFYPVDPRGLAVFDTSLANHTTGHPVPGSTNITPPSVDAAMLSSRLTSLRTLAEATDGLAIVNNNDLSAGFKRIVDDLSSYYLLGYYSTGKLDGKFHSITVRVKRPGVQVRARRGFLAATPGDMTAARPSASASPEAAAAAAEAHAVEAVVAPLDNYMREVPLRVQIAAGWTAAAPPTAAVWLVGEVGGTATAADGWAQGAEAEITMTSTAGATIATAHTAIPAGARSFRATLRPADGAAPIPPGDYAVRVSVRGAAAGGVPSRDTVHVAVPAAPESTGAIVLRRGQSTSNRDVPTADLRFRRSERIRVEVPAPNASTVSARLLDRSGKPLTLPVTAAMRDEADGSRWATAQLALAPLAAGDYVIEMSGRAGGSGGAGAFKKLIAFRIVP
jgi:VWFA-related protein